MKLRESLALSTEDSLRNMRNQTSSWSPILSLKGRFVKGVLDPEFLDPDPNVNPLQLHTNGKMWLKPTARKPFKSAGYVEDVNVHTKVVSQTT